MEVKCSFILSTFFYQLYIYLFNKIVPFTSLICFRLWRAPEMFFTSLTTTILCKRCFHGKLSQYNGILLWHSISWNWNMYLNLLKKVFKEINFYLLWGGLQDKTILKWSIVFWHLLKVFIVIIFFKSSTLNVEYISVTFTGNIGNLIRKYINKIYVFNLP